MLSSCCEKSILGTYWTTRYSVVSEQTCTIDHKMDQSLWQTIISFDLLPSWYMWLQTILSCGKHCQTMQIGTVSRLRFCRRPWGLEIYIRWNIWHFRKSYVLFQPVGSVRNKLQFHTFRQNQNHFLGRRIEVGRYNPLLIYGIWLFQFLETRLRTMSERGRPVVCPHTIQKRKQSRRVINDLDSVDFIPILRIRKLCVYVFEDNEAVIKMIIKGKKSHNETCFQDSQSCSWLGYLIESIWTPRSKSNTLTPQTNSQTSWPKGNFTRDEWNHLLCLFDISHFSSTNCLEGGWRKSHSKIEGDDEFGLAMQRKGS